MLLAFTGWSEQNDLGLSIDQHILLDAMAFFLATIEKALKIWICVPLNGPFGTTLKEKSPFFIRQMQILGTPGRFLAQLCQGSVQAGMQNMDPFIGTG
jgi:hypothetical protein